MVNTELSKKLKGNRFKIGHCYKNAYTVFIENKELIKYLVIGYCKAKEDTKVIRHAWNVDLSGNVVDVTLKKADLEKMEYYEAFKYTLEEFREENIMAKTSGAPLLGLHTNKELDCLKKNNLKVMEIDYYQCIKAFI